MKNVFLSCTVVLCSASLLSLADVGNEICKANLSSILEQNSSNKKMECQEKCIAPKCDHFYASLEYLYWQAKQPDMIYALTSDNISSLDSLLFASFSNLKNQEQNSEWHSGFRVGFGYKFCPGYDASLKWTHLNVDPSTSVSGPVIFPSQLTFLVLGGASVGGDTFDLGPARSSWNFNFDAVDLDLGYCCFCNKKFSFSPFFGLKAAFIDQKQTIEYQNFLVIADESTPSMNAVVIENNDISGVGPKVGFNSDYLLGKHFKLFGNFGLALLYSDFDSFTKFSMDFTPADFPLPTEFHYNDDTNMFLPMAQLELGIAWTKHFCKQRSSISFGLAYDAQYFWNTWRHQNSTLQNAYLTDVGYSNLSLQGVTAQLIFGF